MCKGPILNINIHTASPSLSHCCSAPDCKWRYFTIKSLSCHFISFHFFLNWLSFMQVGKCCLDSSEEQSSSFGPRTCRGRFSKVPNTQQLPRRTVENFPSPALRAMEIFLLPCENSPLPPLENNSESPHWEQQRILPAPYWEQENSPLSQ